jgi:hypothetical protein
LALSTLFEIALEPLVLRSALLVSFDLLLELFCSQRSLPGFLLIAPIEIL